MLKIHQIIHLKSVYFIICKCHLSFFFKIPIASPPRNTKIFVSFLKEKSYYPGTTKHLEIRNFSVQIKY